MKRFVLFAAAIVLLCGGVVSAQAQTVTPIPLPVGHVTNGSLYHSGESVTYRVDVPALMDLGVNYGADALILVDYCLLITGKPVCPNPHGGGGDGDPPVSGTIDIPSSDTAQTVLITVDRPPEGLVNYWLALSSVVVDGLSLDESLTVNPHQPDIPGAAYHSYVLNVDPAQPFVIQIEDVAANGDFLWVAHQPYINGSFTPTEVHQNFPLTLDAADRGNNEGGVHHLQLDYLGGHQFRVFVISFGAYLIHTRSLNVQPLDAGVTLPLTISYRNPLAVVRLNADPGDVAKVDFQIPEGKRAVAEVYQEGGSIGDSLELGYNGNSRTTAPVAGTIHEVATERPLYALMQLGDGSTRDPLRVTLGWTKES